MLCAEDIRPLMAEGTNFLQHGHANLRPPGRDHRRAGSGARFESKPYQAVEALLRTINPVLA
jgi:hypothetical protein